jgi:pyruvate formate-lyase activating enzyme-like uncharacterized protein
MIARLTLPISPWSPCIEAETTHGWLQKPTRTPVFPTVNDRMFRINRIIDKDRVDRLGINIIEFNEHNKIKTRPDNSISI